MNNALQTNIRRQLQEKNMSAAELERRTGIPHAVINILHGRSKNPSIRTAQAIAKELGCSIEELFSEQQSNIDNINPCNLQLYKSVFNVMCEHIEKLNLQPTPEQMSSWLSDIYKYSQSSPEKRIDLRFVQWLLER